MSPKRASRYLSKFRTRHPSVERRKYGKSIQRTLHATLKLHERLRREETPRAIRREHNAVNENAERDEDPLRADIAEVLATPSPKTRTRKGRTTTQALNAVLRQTTTPR